MKIKTQIEMEASKVVGSSVHTGGESVVESAGRLVQTPIDRTIIEPTNLVQLELADGRVFTMAPDTKANVTVVIEFDDDQVGKFDANGELIV